MKDTGGSAYPENGYGSPDGLIRLDTQKGMTLRDRFAIQAITLKMINREPEDIAKHAYKVADAMIKERNKGE